MKHTNVPEYFHELYPHDLPNMGLPLPRPWSRSLTPECQRRPVNLARLKRAQLGNRKDLMGVPRGVPKDGQIWPNMAKYGQILF